MPAGPGSRAWGKAAAALEVVQQPYSAQSRLAEAAAAALENSREQHRPRVQFEKVFSLDYLAQDGDVVLQPVPLASQGDPVQRWLLGHSLVYATSKMRVLLESAPMCRCRQRLLPACEVGVTVV